MTRILLTAAASGLALMIAACGQDAGQDAQNEATVGNDMNAMMADPNNPFAQAEMSMHDRMMSAVGINAGDSWIRKMIEHHRGAVEMSRQLLTLNPPANVAEMAQMAIDKQGKEISGLEKLVTSGNPDPASGELYRAASTAMHNAMMAAKGADVSQTYLRKMLEHHKGAVALSDVALANGVTGPVRAQVEKTKADQQKEISHLEAMLRGEIHQAAATAQPPTPAAEPKTETARTEPKAAPKAPPKAAPKAEPAEDPHAGHVMNNSQ